MTPSGGLRLGALVLPEQPGPAGAEVWDRIEQLGLHSGWTLDHLAAPTQRDGQRHRPWYDAMSTLAAAAHRTSRLVLGTLVVSPAARHPVVTARQAATLDMVSDGRFVLGLGAGRARPAMGESAARFEEFVTLVDLLLREPVTTYTGRFFTVSGVEPVPGCGRHRRLPLGVAATGPRGMRLAARLADLWLTAGDAYPVGPPSDAGALGTLRRQLARLDEACAAAGRPPGALRRLVYLSRLVADPCGSPERLVDLLGCCAELGCTDVVLAYPQQTGEFAGDPRAFERAVGHALAAAPEPAPSRG